MSKWHYFEEVEVVGLNPEFIALLDRARHIAMTPFVITSGRRSTEENEKLPNAKQDSSHLTGNAVDLRCENSIDRYKILKGLFAVGFCRIGIYVDDGHIHVDNDMTKPQGVVWLTK